MNFDKLSDNRGRSVYTNLGVINDIFYVSCAWD